MKGNREKFLELVSKESTNTSEKNKEMIANREWLRVSRDIAFKILEKLDELGWTQKELAEKMEVSPQYISKMLKGSENLTLESLAKIQRILEIPILASYYEQNKEKVMEFSGDEKPSITATLVCVEYSLEFSFETKQKTETTNIYQPAC